MKTSFSMCFLYTKHIHYENKPVLRVDCCPGGAAAIVTRRAYLDTESNDVRLVLVLLEMPDLQFLANWCYLAVVLRIAILPLVSLLDCCYSVLVSLFGRVRFFLSFRAAVRGRRATRMCAVNLLLIRY